MDLEKLLIKKYSESSLTVHFEDSRSYLNRRFAEQNAKLDRYHRVEITMRLITVAAVIYPYIERLMAL